jgi:hypothetical protein
MQSRPELVVTKAVSGLRAEAALPGFRESSFGKFEEFAIKAVGRTKQHRTGLHSTTTAPPEIEWFKINFNACQNLLALSSSCTLM